MVERGRFTDWNEQTVSITKPRVRASFDLRLVGREKEVAKATECLGDQLTERGYMSDEDWSYLPANEAELPGLQFRTLASLRAALDLLSPLGIYMVETDREEV